MLLAMTNNKLGRFEFELVEHIASNPGPVREIVADYAAKKGITRGSIVKSLDRLVKKGAVQRALVDGLYSYSVQQTTAELQDGAIQNFVQAHLRGKVSPIAAFLVKDKRLSPKEIEAIQAIIARMEAGEKEGG
jgi:predicted transcriptional regulator